MGQLIHGFTVINDNYTITNCHNGFVVEVSGKDRHDEWNTSKFVFTSLEQVKRAVEELASMPRG
jgi:hypothetical protein